MPGLRTSFFQLRRQRQWRQDWPRFQRSESEILLQPAENSRLEAPAQRDIEGAFLRTDLESTETQSIEAILTMSKKDLKAACRALGCEVPKSATAKDLRAWLLVDAGALKGMAKRTPSRRMPLVPTLVKAAPPPLWFGGSGDDAAYGHDDLEEKALSPLEPSKDLVEAGGPASRRCGGASEGRGEMQTKTSGAEPDAEELASTSASAEWLANGGEGEPPASGRGGFLGAPRKIFGCRSKGKAIERLERVLENLGEGSSKDGEADEGEEPRTFLKASDCAAQRALPGAATRRSLQSARPRELFGIALEEEARGVVTRPLTWAPQQEKETRSFSYGPELFWRQLRRLRPRPGEAYTDFAAQVTGLVGAWVEEARAKTREEVIELIRLEHVVDQLPEQLCQLVLAHRPKTAMEAAALADGLAFQRGHQLASGSGIWPWFCQVPGNPAGKGPKRGSPRTHTFRREAVPKKEPQSSGGGWGWKPTPVRTCQKCGKVGHLQANCPYWSPIDS